MQWFAGGRGYLQAYECGAEAAAECNHLYRSDDNGDTWALVDGPNDGGIVAWQFVSPDRGYAATLRNVWETKDAARTWRQVSPGSLGFATFDATSTHILAPAPLDADPSGITRIDLTSGARSSAAVPGHAAFSDIAFGSRERGYALNGDGLWIS